MSNKQFGQCFGNIPKTKKKITKLYTERKNGSAISITCYSTVWLRCTYFKAQNLHFNSVSQRDVHAPHSVTRIDIYTYIGGIAKSTLVCYICICRILRMRSNFDAVEIYSCKFPDSHWCRHDKLSNVMCVQCTCTCAIHCTPSAKFHGSWLETDVFYWRQNIETKKKQSQLQL